MNTDTDSLGFTAFPLFLTEAEEIKNILQGKTAKELQELWKCNDSIAKPNVKRLLNMNLRENLTPAILSYEGIQYRYMAPGVFEDGHYDYIDEHLRILSGFYGLLRPFDGVVPYRLEMQAKLPINGKKDLYDFWGNKLAVQLMKETDLILNLASEEYSRAIIEYLPKGFRLISCIFGEVVNNRIVEKGTLCKMARGQMVRWIAENNITSSDSIKKFDGLGYTYREEYSTDETFVLIKDHSPKN
jgi:cytoplasmic iron level regulating protein YaaA (DUF328/UPF0246 family)